MRAATAKEQEERVQMKGCDRCASELDAGAVVCVCATGAKHSTCPACALEGPSKEVARKKDTETERGL